ncbi:hypothetical protein HNP92_000845 [Methanococcus maripaludis]|uniref:Uncharacterized protein n=1 Tax=Methanococcus maripaludis TaxID=39152 RepID=A0A7J9S5G9_METMI|nr:hypothetical protein [Methanococcus maripaludis]MBB6401560.1 hypothetical protein [Methanococcus maripaludis]
MKLKAFLMIFAVLFSGIATNMGHEDVSSVTFQCPECYTIISGNNAEISATAAGRVDGNYYLNDVEFSYSKDGIDWETIGTCYIGVEPGRGEDVTSIETCVEWNINGLDGRYLLRGIANYNYSSPLPDSETSDESLDSNKGNGGKYGKYSLSGITFLKYDFKKESSESNRPEGPGEMPDTKSKSGDEIVVYISNGGDIPEIKIVRNELLGTDILLLADVEDPFNDLVNKVVFEYRYLDGGTWTYLGETDEKVSGDYAYFWNILGRTGEYKIRAYMLNANEEVIGVANGNLCLTDTFEDDVTIFDKSEKITLP